MPVTTEQALATLRARIASEQAQQQAAASAIRARLMTEVPLRLPTKARAWLIGSLAWGGFGPHSDVDVVVCGSTHREACQLELALTACLRVPVEVLRYEDLPSSFQERIEREGLSLHGS